jgi:ferric-dicitrate binding protein FerR (iron transport regulator)
MQTQQFLRILIGVVLILALKPGKSVRLEAGVPQAAGQHAGKVTGLIPVVTVQHAGKGTPIVLKLSNPIFWEDLVETQGNGRVRITFDGGSFLNIGARSQVRIVQHDAQSQQTAVELRLGSLRCEVVKLTEGGKFETRTPTALIEVVGTDYFVIATPRLTRVWSTTGDVTVRNIDPKVPGEVTLHTGQAASVQQGKPPQMNSKL